MTFVPRCCRWFAVLVCVVCLSGHSARTARAIDFPGPPPGAAKARADAGGLLLENDVLACKWSLVDGRFAAGSAGRQAVGASRLRWVASRFSSGSPDLLRPRRFGLRRRS